MKRAYIPLAGRLGNHFFILSAAKYLESFGFDVIIMIRKYQYERKNIDDKTTYLKQNFNCLDESGELYERILSEATNIVNYCNDHLEKYINYDTTLYFNISYFQNAKYYFHNKEYIDNIFNYSSNNILNYNVDHDNSVFISCRRGDYIDAGFFILSSQYYIDMYNTYFKGKDIYISCDDINWCKENLKKEYFSKCKNIYYLDNLSSIEILNLSKQFKYYILANSSFSAMCELSSIYEDKLAIAVPNINYQFNRINMFDKYTLIYDIIKNKELNKYIDK